LSSQLVSDPQKEKEFEELLAKWRGVKGGLIPVLQGAQAIYGYLPKEVMVRIAKELKVPPSQVYGVATFYAQFRFTPRGRHIIRVCHGTACHVKGAERLSAELENRLGIKPGEATPDLRFTLENVACLGCCSLAPVIMINEDTYGNLTPDKIKDILDKYE